MDDRDLIEKLEAIREVIDWIEKKEQLYLNKTIDNPSAEENFKQ